MSMTTSVVCSSYGSVRRYNYGDPQRSAYTLSPLEASTPRVASPTGGPETAAAQRNVWLHLRPGMPELRTRLPHNLSVWLQAWPTS